MRIVKCDLCGKECGNEKISNTSSLNLIPPGPSLSLRWDLCETCANKVIDYLNKGEKHEADDTAESHTPEMS